MDGRFHPWLEAGGCLIDMADDATNMTWAQLGEQETIWAVADALRAWIEQYGVPLALYVDWKKLVQAAGQFAGAFTNERTIGNDWVVRYANHYFQLEPQSRHYAPARSKVLVCEGRHGGISIEYRGRALGWKQIAAPLKPPPRAEAVGARVAVGNAKRKWVPPADHPWREAARHAVQQKALREVARAPLAWPCASP